MLETLNKAIICVPDGGGKFIPVQTLDEYNNGERNMGLLTYQYGNNLYNILADELGYIRVENNKMIFSFVIFQDVVASAMKILGRVAEAVIVKNCNKDSGVNKEWFKIARRATRLSGKSDNYFAIGTGLNTTKRLYSHKFNPGDTQRDIKWLNRHDPSKELLMISKKMSEGIVAGVQVKASLIGKKYVLDDLIYQRYEVPLVYFGVGQYNDFTEVAQELFKRKNSVTIGEDFVDGGTLDNETYREIKEYVPLITKLVKNEITPEQLLNTEDALLNAVLTSTVLEPFTDISLITN
jgi:hypothetical protein|nr:hypothetical protein [uncultured Lachnoclostridium sp.]